MYYGRPKPRGGVHNIRTTMFYGSPKPMEVYTIYVLQCTMASLNRGEVYIIYVLQCTMADLNRGEVYTIKVLQCTMACPYRGETHFSVPHMRYFRDNTVEVVGKDCCFVTIPPGSVVCLMSIHVETVRDLFFPHYSNITWCKYT